MRKLHIKSLLMVFIVMICLSFNATAQETYELSLTADNKTATATFSFTSDSSQIGNTYDVMLAFYNDKNTLVQLSGEFNKTIIEGLNTVSFEEEIPSDAIKAKAFCWGKDLTSLAYKEIDVEPLRSIKILAIGNSFSVDAMQHLYPILIEGGYDEVVLGNLYIGGCTLETHANNAANSSKSYKYYKNTTGTWTSTSSQTMLKGITDEDWDVITMQQASGSSGMPDTYETYLDSLVSYVEENKTNPDAKLGWHMTWAYQQNSTHSEFSNYDSNQLTMYNAIVNAVNTIIIPNESIDIVIPSGTAIQNVRTSYIGDTLTRDGYHLSYNLGRYIAALTWAKVLGDVDIEVVEYSPNESDVDENTRMIVKEAVNAAALMPFEVTQSSYEEVPKMDTSNHTLIDWEPTACAFYNSTDSNSMSGLFTTKSNSKYFIASKIFTKDEIPVGSIIEIDSGYQYRPEGWKQLDEANTSSSRPGNVTSEQVLVTEDWWGSFNYRAFNVSVVGGNTDISQKLDEVKDYFRIYVPNK